MADFNLLEKVENMKVLEIKDGDTLIVKLNCIANDKQVKTITHQLKRALELPDNIKVIVMEEGMDIGVIRQG
ncbi:MAG: hypothetical protein WA125_16595 [Desulfosporosinus sp.]